MLWVHLLVLFQEQSFILAPEWPAFDFRQLSFHHFFFFFRFQNWQTILTLYLHIFLPIARKKFLDFPETSLVIRRCIRKL